VSVRVRIPTPLRAATDGAAELSVEGPSVASVIAELETRYPAMRGRLRDETGAMRRFVNLYVNGQDVRFQDGLETSLKAGDELSIVPAVAGGEGDLRRG
jgi:molybdopterin synthase sulfur carrier subunit